MVCWSNSCADARVYFSITRLSCQVCEAPPRNYHAERLKRSQCAKSWQILTWHCSQILKRTLKIVQHKWSGPLTVSVVKPFVEFIWIWRKDYPNRFLFHRDAVVIDSFKLLRKFTVKDLFHLSVLSEEVKTARCTTKNCHKILMASKQCKH